MLTAEVATERADFTLTGAQSFIKAGGLNITKDGDVTVAALQITGTGATPTLGDIDAFWNGTNTAAGTSTGGRVTLGRLGSGTGTAGRQVKVTFGTAYANTPNIAITPRHSGSVGNAYTFHLGGVTTTYFEIYLQVAPTTTGDDTLNFNWVVIG